MILRHSYNLSLQSYNLENFLKIAQSCTGFLGVAGPSLVFHQWSIHVYNCSRQEPTGDRQHK